MCTTNTLQQHIRDLTNEGELVARFLVDTVSGKHTDAKFHHRIEAAKQLNRYFPADAEGAAQVPPLPAGEGWGERTNSTPSPLMGEEPTPSEGRGWDGGEGKTENSKLITVNFLDILNYDMAHLIRTETADGRTIAEFLVNTMTLSDKPYTSKKLRIKPADRMAASREIINRGFGHFGRKRKLVIDDCSDTNDYDTLHTDLARRLREYSENGTDAVRFLIEVMSNKDPEQEFTRHHRVSAAQELLRRGWDTNYDRITPEMLQDFWRNQESPRLSVEQNLRETEDSISAGVSGITPQSPTSMPPLPEGEGCGEGTANTPSPSNDETGVERECPAIDQPEYNAAISDSTSLPPRWGKVRMGVADSIRSHSENQESGDDCTENPPSSGEWARACPEPAEGMKGADNTPSPSMGEDRNGSEYLADSQNQAATPANPTIDDHDKTIIREFQQAMNSGDLQSAIRAEMKFAGRMLDRRFRPYTAPTPDSTPQQQHAQPGSSGQPDSNHRPPRDAARRGYYDLLDVPMIGSTANGMPVSAAPPTGKPRKPNIRGP